MRRRKLRTGNGPPSIPADVDNRHGRTAAVADGAKALESGAADLDKYLVHVAHLDMPLTAKIELIRAVRQMMQSFVDRAFGDDPTQLSLKAEGKSHEKRASLADPMLGLVQDTPQHPDMLTSDFRRNAEAREEKANDS